MKTSQKLLNILSLSALVFVMAACHAKVEAPSMSLPSVDNNPPPEQKQVSPNESSYYNGTWTSGCYKEKFGFNSLDVFTLVDGIFTRDVKIFQSVDCTGPELQSVHDTGTIEIVSESKNQPGSFEIKIYADRGNGVTQISYDMIRFENGKLFLGDLMAPKDGEFPTKVDMEKAYSKQ